MHIRLQTWLPFTIQVCLNGREYLARRMDRAGIGYERRGNYFRRIKTTINNPRRFKVRRRAPRQGRRTLAWIPMRKGVADVSGRVEISRAANERYLEALSVVDLCSVAHPLLDPVSRRVIRDGRPYRPLRPITREETDVFRVILRGEFALRGFGNQDLRRHLCPAADEADPVRRRKASGRMTRLLRLLRAHRLIRKVSGTRYYRVTPRGHHVMTTALQIRHARVTPIAA